MLTPVTSWDEPSQLYSTLCYATLSRTQLDSTQLSSLLKTP